MTEVWFFVMRAVIASSYLTLVVARPESAKRLALVYAAIVAGVAVYDVWWRHHEPRRR